MTGAEHDEAIARGLCKSRGTGQCAALCLSHMSIHTTNGQCPEARSIWHREIASIRAQLAARGLAIVPTTGAGTPQEAAELAEIKAKIPTEALLENNDLVSELALLFHDAMSVNSLPSDYAKRCIRIVCAALPPTTGADFAEGKWNVGEKLTAIQRLLIEAAIGSCECGMKTADILYHSPMCRFVKLSYALENVELALADIQNIVPTTGAGDAYRRGQEEMRERAQREAENADGGYRASVLVGNLTIRSLS